MQAKIVKCPYVSSSAKQMNHQLLNLRHSWSDCSPLILTPSPDQSSWWSCTWNRWVCSTIAFVDLVRRHEFQLKSTPSATCHADAASLIIRVHAHLCQLVRIVLKLDHLTGFTVFVLSTRTRSKRQWYRLRQSVTVKYIYILIELMEKVKGKHNGAGADHGGSPRKYHLQQMNIFRP